MGYELRNNRSLQFDNRDAFVAYMNEGQPVRPANILNIVAINQGKSPLTMETPSSVALQPRRIREFIAEGHLVVDGRSPGPFGEGHIPGSYNINVRSPEFEQRVGWVTPLDRPIVLVVEEEADADCALHKLAFLGLDRRVAGHLHGGIRTWTAAGFELSSLPQQSVEELDARLKAEPALQVLDVRALVEWDEGHVKGAHHMNYRDMRDQMSGLTLNPDAPIAVMCGGGGRSSTACSLLMQRGFKNVFNITGGMTAWRSAKLPLAGSAESCPTNSE